MSVFVAVAAAAVASYALKYGAVAALTRWRLPAPVAAALRFVAPASIGALLVVTLRADLPTLDHADVLARAAGLLVAGVAAARTRSATTAVLLGVPTVWIVTVLA
jgi:branched-subunit amino acid transport protein